MDENAQPVGSPGRLGKHVSALPRLAEITASEANTRNPTTMPPPTTLKRERPSGLPEPSAKRKTQADKVAEFPTSQSAAPLYNRSVNGTTIGSAVHGGRNASLASSTSSRTFSNSTRTASSTSTTSMRPPAAGAYRPQSAMSVNKNPLKTSAYGHRPATSLDGHPDDNTSKRMGTVPSHSIYPFPVDPFSVHVPRVRQHGKSRADETYTPYSTSTASIKSSRSARNANPFGELPIRNASICTQMKHLNLNNTPRPVSSVNGNHTGSPSKIPAPAALARSPQKIPDTPPLRSKSSRKSISPQKEPVTPTYLTKESNTTAAWDTKGRLDDMQKSFDMLKEQMSAASKQPNQQEIVEVYKTRVNELESIRNQLYSTQAGLQGELEGLKVKLNSTTVALEDNRRTHTLEVDDLRRKHRNELEDLRDEYRRSDEGRKTDAQSELDLLRRQHADIIADIELKLKSELEEERSRRVREVQDIQSQWTLHRQHAELDASTRDREEQKIRAEIDQLHASVEHERKLNASLRDKIAESAAQAGALESSLDAAKAKTHFLESDSQAQSQAFADLNARMQQAIESAAEANAKLRAEETIRRKLHNQVQELKGNIRVFCRVRPTLGSDADEAAKLVFPDASDESKELVLTGPEAKSAIGTDRTSKHSFSFDRVFGPSAQNPEVFEEISQLVQSALDGYNVCIFCYGQTGSGKTHTMSSSDGMIPLAVQQIYETAGHLEEKGWRYSMEGSFVEVYNENLNDLLGSASDLDKKKLDIKHDLQKGKTTITDVTVVPLDSPSTVTSLLDRAASNRSVAATKANERSSRSHSVFILKLEGENSITGEKSEGTLNLVDLAGSERLAHSGATGDRLKETQNINKSLSSLGDVIAALGQGKDGAHIPYRNSKLTYLLQQSLGGNSKTLMFVMVSPLQPHLGETITSLKFATKVHNTHIGTAKKQTKVKD